MIRAYNYILLWAEVWPLAILLLILLIWGRRKQTLRPILLFAIVSLPLTLIAVLIQNYTYAMPAWLKSNGIFYNIIYIIRTILLGWYLLQLKEVKAHSFTKYILPAYGIFVVLNFLLFERESPLNFSSNLAIAECLVLLALSLIYFLSTILDDESEFSFGTPEALFCVGLSLFEAINIFIYLFMFHLYISEKALFFLLFKISSYSFILLYLLLCLSVYRSSLKIRSPVFN